MPVFKPYTRSNARSIIDFNRLTDRLALGDIVLCLPIALVDIIRVLLSERGLWRTTYAISYGEVGYSIPDEAEFNQVRQMILSFLEETAEMNCNSLLTALRDIASAIRTSACCAPGQNIHYVDVGGVIYYGSEQPLDKPTVFGEGQEFATEAEFSQHLCDAANNIVAGLILSLNNWSVLSVASLLAGGLIIAFFVANPPLALLLTLAGLGFAFATFVTIANYIDDNREDWVCAIYGADSYADMLVGIDQKISEMVVTLDIGPFEIALTDIIHAMITTDVFNQAYTAVGLPAPINPVDCDNCPQDVVFEWYGNPANIDGTMTDLGNGRWRWVCGQPNWDTDKHYINFRATVGGVPVGFVLTNVSLTNYTLSPSIGESGGEKTPGPDTYDAPTVGDLEQHLEDQTTIANFYLYSLSAFTMECDVAQV